MEKAITTMRGWHIENGSGRYNLCGEAENHPRLGRNVYVAHTTTVQRFRLEQDTLIYETRNTIYKCPLKYMDTENKRDEIDEERKLELQREILENEPHNDLDRIMHLRAKLILKEYRDDEDVKRIAELIEAGKIEMKEAVRKENERMIEIAKQYEDCVYLEAYNISQGDKMAYNLEGCTGIVNPIVHLGMFQDSILYRGYIYENDSFFDFRYFPEGLNIYVESDLAGHLPQGFVDGIETYTWSDNIKYAVIKNMRKGNISFNNEQIAPGETKVFRNPS